MVTKIWKKIKHQIGENGDDVIIAVSFFLIAVISFGIGRLSVSLTADTPLRIQQNTISHIEEHEPARHMPEEGRYVASQNGTVYHLPDCPGAKRIHDENKIWFSSQKEAESLGYRAAKNCDIE